MRTLCRIAVAILFLFFGCTKIETTEIGSGLIPPIDGVTTLDTFLVVSTNNIDDSSRNLLRVYKGDDHVIGVINNDPLFGKTTAQAFLELKPPSYTFAFPGGESLAADSAVLILSYKGVFGDTTVNQDWEVRELSEAMQGDSAYPVSKQFATGSLLGSKNVTITSFNDSVNYGFELANNQIRIKLAPEFANRFIQEYDSTAGNAYQNDSSFRLKFKGFAVGPAAGSPGNALIRVNLLDTNTKLALFYNYKIPDSANKTLAVSYFRFSTGSLASVPVSGSANYIKREYNSPLAANLTNSTLNDSVLFVETSPGTIATVHIPGLSGLQNAIIHKAELAMYELPPDQTSLNMNLTLPAYLLLSSYDQAGNVKTNIPNDFVVSTSSAANTSTFGGYPTLRAVPGYGAPNAYIFDLTRYVQGIVTRKDSSLTLRLSAPSNDSLKYTAPYPATTTSTSTYYLNPANANNVAMGRVRLAGGGISGGNPLYPLRVRLRIIYSKI